MHFIIKSKVFRNKTLKIAALLAAGFTVLFYALHDPAADAYAPRCVFKALTGYDCPGCGFQRAMHALLTGDVAAAWGFNPFLFFMMPVAALYLMVELRPDRFPRLQKHLFASYTIIIILLFTLAWWIGRNCGTRP